MARRARVIESPEYIRFLRRIVRSAGLRVSDADADELMALVAIRADLDLAIAAAVQGLRRNGATWADIGQATMTSRQAAWEKWGKPAPIDLVAGRG